MSVRNRALTGAIASLVVVGGGVGLYAVNGPEQAAPAVQVDDTAQVLHEPTLQEEVGRLRFHEPTTVAIFSHRGGEAARTDDYALNDAVLAHARDTRTEWLSDDEQKWADDLFILGVDPEGRLVGTYFGENRAVGQGAQDAIQDATKDDFRAGRWTDGAVEGVRSAAGRMNRPVVRGPGGIVGATTAGLLTVGGAAAYLGVGLRRARRSQEARAAGDRHLASVVREMDVTELHARLIPEESTYGGLMLRRYDDYVAGFRELTELGNQAREIDERAYDDKRSLKVLEAYRDQGRSLAHLHTVIDDTAAFLNRDRTWREAWERQVAPVREDLEGVSPLFSGVLANEVRGLPEVATLREFASEELVGLDQLRGDLEEDTVTPDEALDRLRTTRDRLSTHLDALAAAVARASGRTATERNMMRDSMKGQRSRTRFEPTILSTADPTWMFYRVSSFRSGYTAGTTAVAQSRSGSSSGGSTSGYSSSGGSFSGSGSSSRF